MNFFKASKSDKTRNSVCYNVWISMNKACNVYAGRTIFINYYNERLIGQCFCHRIGFPIMFGFLQIRLAMFMLVEQYLLIIIMKGS